MKRAKLEELVADLGYALLHLKEAQAQGIAYGSLNRSRELVSKVGEALKGELDKANASQSTTTRMVKAIQAARKLDLFRDAHLSLGKLRELYDIVVKEFDNWDGEEVAAEHIAKLMGQRYMHHGLSPSRN